MEVPALAVGEDRGHLHDRLAGSHEQPRESRGDPLRERSHK